MLGVYGAVHQSCLRVVADRSDDSGASWAFVSFENPRLAMPRALEHGGLVRPPGASKGFIRLCLSEVEIHGELQRITQGALRNVWTAQSRRNATERLCGSLPPEVARDVAVRRRRRLERAKLHPHTAHVLSLFWTTMQHEGALA